MLEYNGKKMFRKFINNDLEDKIHSSTEFTNLLKVSNKPKAISFVNPFSYKILTHKSELIKSIDYFFSDGALLCTLTNLRRRKKIDRVSFDFTSIANEVFSFASSENKAVALIGGSKQEIADASEYILGRYPNLNLIYFRDGYFSQDEFQSVIHEIDKNNVDIVIAGMGTPLQDDFIASIKKQSKSVYLSFTCGGFLTQTSLKGDYYHPVIKKLGLRWLQRCFMHKHVRSRLLKDYPIFLLSYILNINLK